MMEHGKLIVTVKELAPLWIQRGVIYRMVKRRNAIPEDREKNSILPGKNKKMVRRRGREQC